MLALNKVVSQEKFKNKLECIFIGKQTDNFINRVKELDLDDYVKVLPRMSYFDTLNELSKSDISLIIEAICDEGIYLPTKVVDSIQCKIPLFCISPLKGTLKDLIDKHKIGYCADNKSIENIEENLINLITDYQNNSLPVIKIDQFTEFFENDILSSYTKILETFEK